MKTPLAILLFLIAVICAGAGAAMGATPAAARMQCLALACTAGGLLVLQLPI